MSHEIEYNRQFIRSECGITPLVLFGDSSLSTTILDSRGRSHERIVRSWGTMLNMFGVDTKDIMARLETVTGRTQQHWKRNGKWVDDKMLINWGKSGIKNAMTLEEIREQNPLIVLNCHLDKYGKDCSHEELFARTITSTVEFDSWIKEAKILIKSATNDEVYASIAFNEEDLKVCKQKRFEGAAIVKYKNFCLYEQTDGRYVYTKAGDFSVFPNFETAMKAAIKGYLRPFRILPSLRTACYVIREDGVHNHGMYYCETNGKHVYDTDDIRHAQTYKRFKDADRQAERLMAKPGAERSIRSVVAITP